MEYSLAHRCQEHLEDLNPFSEPSELRNAFSPHPPCSTTRPETQPHPARVFLRGSDPWDSSRSLFAATQPSLPFLCGFLQDVANLFDGVLVVLGVVDVAVSRPFDPSFTDLEDRTAAPRGAGQRLGVGRGRTSTSVRSRSKVKELQIQEEGLLGGSVLLMVPEKLEDI